MASFINWFCASSNVAAPAAFMMACKNTNSEAKYDVLVRAPDKYQNHSSFKLSSGYGDSIPNARTGGGRASRKMGRRPETPLQHRPTMTRRNSTAVVVRRPA